MNYIYSLDDEYIKTYLMDIYISKDVNDDDIRDTFSNYFNDEIIQKILEERKIYLENFSEQKDGNMACNITNTSHDLNNHNEVVNIEGCSKITDNSQRKILKEIVKKYAYLPVTNNTCNPHLVFDETNNKKVRYRNNMVVTCKGEKYI